MRILTCNTEGSALDPVALGKLIVEFHPDVVMLQEWADQGAATVLLGAWVAHPGGRWLCLASRFPIQKTVLLDLIGRRGRGAYAYCRLESPDRSISVFNIHVATLRSGLEAVLWSHWEGIQALNENVALQWYESDRARRSIDQVGSSVILAGDFNLPVESPVYRRFWSRFANAFSSAGVGFGPTKFTRWIGLRIDHVLSGPVWGARAPALVGPDVGSDHRPVIADLKWIGPRSGS